MEIQRNSFFSDLFLVFLAICLVAGLWDFAKEIFGPLETSREIDLSFARLPLYAFFSLSRGLAAFFLSLVFSLGYGFWAAKDPVAEKILIPLLDVLQSIPFLGFLPGIVLVLTGFFKTTNVGLELAAIVLIFTGQVWNMAFGVYQSIRAVPEEKRECAKAYNLTGWQLARWIELPFTALSLVWNSIMSVAGGWFFLMAIETYKLGDQNFRLPGLGSYMSAAVAAGDVMAMMGAILAMIVLILVLDQLLWRPLVVWSQKFRIEETGPSLASDTWFLSILKNSYLIGCLQKGNRYLRRVIQNARAGKAEKSSSGKFFAVGISRFFLFVLFSLVIVTVVFVGHLTSGIAMEQWISLSKMALLTFSRVCSSLLISVSIALPLGLAVGLSEKWSRILEPVIQVGASFPATLLFPLIVVILRVVGIPLGIGSIVLLLMGTIWYVLFNVIAGAKAMPSDLREVAAHFRFNRKQRFFWLHLPAVFPYLVTGMIAASGGAWNASIVAEYIEYKGQVMTTPGIGSSISLAAQNNDMPLLGASILVLLVVVVTLNLGVWLRLYHYSERRFAIND